MLARMKKTHPFVKKQKGLRNSPKPLESIGAGEEIRTLDIDLGKVALYH